MADRKPSSFTEKALRPYTKQIGRNTFEVNPRKYDEEGKLRSKDMGDDLPMSREGSPVITDMTTGEQMYSIPSSEETYKAVEPALEKETKEYIQSRGFVHGGSVCKGGGKAIRGLGFKGVK